MEEIKKKLDESKLQPCDVVLTTGEGFVSKKIRLYTDSDISHAMIYVQDHSIIDSTGEGVHSQNTQRLMWPEKAGVHVLRLKDGLSDVQKRQIIDFARQKIGTQYSKFEAVATKFGGRDKSSRKQFCSRLVAQAYACAGISIVNDVNYCSPADLLNSPLFIEILDITKHITQEYESAIKNIPDTTELMREATNKLLSGAREKNTHIQDVNDIDQHLISNASDDQYFAKLYRDSGYLDVWKFEYEKNKWQYDINLMHKAHLSTIEKIAYCVSLLNGPDESLRRFDENFRGYQSYFSQYKFETFELLCELYENLLKFHNTRKDVAEKWLLINNPDLVSTTKKTSSLLPHTHEWFSELRRWNPLQATMTEQTIQLAGSVDVCSVCGDDPAYDYLLMDKNPAPGAVLSLRLCNDCLEIRSKQYGESFTPINTHY